MKLLLVLRAKMLRIPVLVGGYLARLWIIPTPHSISWVALDSLHSFLADEMVMVQLMFPNIYFNGVGSWLTFATGESLMKGRGITSILSSTDCPKYFLGWNYFWLDCALVSLCVPCQKTLRLVQGQRETVNLHWELRMTESTLRAEWRVISLAEVQPLPIESRSYTTVLPS